MQPITLEISDYLKNGMFQPFMTGKPFATTYRNPPMGDPSLLFWKAVDNVPNKSTSKMNIRLRGSNGKFISYKKLPETFSNLRTAIEGCPNI